MLCEKKELVGTPPPLFVLKIVYSYVIEAADSKSDLGLYGRALVSEMMVFLRIRVTCIFQLNDLFALLFEKMLLLLHFQSKFPTYTLKSKYPTYTLKSKGHTYTLITLMNLINVKNVKNF